MSACLSLEELDRFATGGAVPGEDEQTHLDTCHACRTAMTAARGDAALFGELQQVFENRSEPAGDDRLAADAIADYRLLHELHRGGQGVVYVAEHAESGARVAIKVQAAVGAVTARDRFEREIDVVSTLAHPNIVRILDRGQCGDRCWFAMPFVDGRQLDAWIASEEPAEKDRLRLFLRVCRAVGYAHRHGVIHRDLKPANILVDQDESPHVLDFGVAKLLDTAHRRLTRIGQFAGTPAYASPEQLDPTRGDATTSTDVFSLGVMLYELLANELPFSLQGDLAAVTARVLGNEPRPPTRLPWALRAIVGRALEKSPAARYASADALADDLERYLTGEPVLHGDSPRWYLLRKAVYRHRRGIAALALVFVAGLGVSATLIYQHLVQRSLRRTAAQVEGVLRDVLAAAGPERMGGGATLLQILEESSRRIEGALHESPDALAAVQFTIGETYLELMMFEEAERHLAIAVERYRASARSDALLARALFGYGVAGVHRHDRAALPRLREALALRRRVVGEGPDGRDLEELQIRRAIALGQIRHPDTDAEDGVALDTLNEILPQFERLCGDSDPEVAHTLHVLATWRMRHGDREAAERLFRAALAIFARPTEDPNPLAVACGSDFAACLLQSDDPACIAEAGELIDRTAALAAHLFGEAQTTRMLRQLARYHSKLEQYEIAEQYSFDAVIHELRFCAGRRPDDRDRLLAIVDQVATGPDDDAARSAMLAGFRCFREFRGRGAYELSSWLNGLARLARALGRHRFAEDLILESLQLHCRVYGKDCPHRFEALRQLAASMVERRGFAAAMPVLEEAQGILTRTGRLDHPYADDVQMLLERCRAGLNGRGR